MTNDKDTRTSNKLKRLKRIKEEKLVRKNDRHFNEEYSEEPLPGVVLERDLPEYEI